MSGWKLKEGKLNTERISEEKYWSLFNYVFSDGSKKRNTYKFGLIKAIMDSLFGAEMVNDMLYISYTVLFEKFAANYWNLIVKYHLKQMRKDGKSELSKIEQIFYSEVVSNSIVGELEFDALEEELRKNIIMRVMNACKKYVIGALYEDMSGFLYEFSLLGTGIYVSCDAYMFMSKFKMELEKLNYYAWAKFLEQVNDDDVLCRVLDKLELATPRRKDLSIYRRILEKEFEEETCFYCGKKLKQAVHVDHFVPWSFLKEDVLWNFVLSCQTCNVKKSNRVPRVEYLCRLTARNREISIRSKNIILIEKQFGKYNERRLERMWEYAKHAGLKEW